MTETIYEHLSGGDTFTVTAAERWSVAMVRRLKEKYPDQVEICYVNRDGSILAHFPADWMRIIPKRRDTLTDEQRAALAERLKSKHGSEKTAQFQEKTVAWGKDIPRGTESEKKEE